MKRLYTTIMLLSASITFAQAFDLPEVIWYHEGMPRAGLFAEEFMCVGDQNGDGYDDLLVNHRALNRVELFYGGEEMDNEPDFLFTTDEEFMALGQYLWYAGNLIPDREPFIAVSKLYRNPDDRPVIAYQQLFESGEELDNEPEFLYSGVFETGHSVPNSAYRSCPFDFNSDGFDDLISRKYLDGTERSFVYYGGADFDTIPDWEAELAGRSAGTRASTGYDINGDGFDDNLLSSSHAPHELTYEMFLGGEEPDHEPIFSLTSDHFEGLILKYGFTLLPDVNGDGYDDWGVHFNDDRFTWDGYYIFYGGEEPDMEPDVLLAGNADGTGDRRGEICGGDFNNDGYGDMVTGDYSAFYGEGQLNYFFGRPHLPDEMEADILINMDRDFEDDYNSTCQFFGAVGDYNGDGVDDVVTAKVGTYGRTLILAGSEDWLVNSVDDKLPVDYTLLLDAYPNPFNSTATIRYQLPRSQNVAMKILDISGREVTTLVNSRQSSGQNQTVWDSGDIPSGVYFCWLKAGSFIQIKKVVLMR